MKQSVKILIIVLSLIIVGLVTFIITDAIIENSRKDSDETVVIRNESEYNSSKPEKNVTANTVENTTVEKNEVSNTNKTAETSKTDTTNNNSEAVEAIKTALKDDEWVKGNVMIKNNTFVDSEIEREQKLTFMVLKQDNKGLPMIAVYAKEGAASEVFIVRYENGKAVANSLKGFHSEHATLQIDPNKYIANYSYGHMSYCEEIYYNIQNGNVVELDSIGYVFTSSADTDEITIDKYYKITENTEISESEYNQIKSKYDGYKFYSIDTNLTDANIDKYIN
ncbi:MAG: hypothetical protein J6A89_05175 [Clostridia bacterium]|nr:hypothetical protein [Clostridia bacterium]